MCRSPCSAPVDYSAKLAAEQGLPFAFAAHFAPEMMFALGESLSRTVQAE